MKILATLEVVSIVDDIAANQNFLQFVTLYIFINAFVLQWININYIIVIAFISNLTAILYI